MDDPKKKPVDDWKGKVEALKQRKLQTQRELMDKYLGDSPYSGGEKTKAHILKVYGTPKVKPVAPSRAKMITRTK